MCVFRKSCRTSIGSVTVLRRLIRSRRAKAATEHSRTLKARATLAVGSVCLSWFSSAIFVGQKQRHLHQLEEPWGTQRAGMPRCCVFGADGARQHTFTESQKGKGKALRRSERSFHKMVGSSQKLPQEDEHHKTGRKGRQIICQKKKKKSTKRK